VTARRRGIVEAWAVVAAARSTERRDLFMPNVLKVIEVLAESDQGWEDAAQKAVDKAKESLHGIRSIYIENFEAKVEDGRITSYRINAKVTFQLD
jgi:flavin-binding protein dodecin